MARTMIHDKSVFDRDDVDDFREPSALLIHEAIRAEGEHELGRPRLDVMWSAVAGGLSLGLTVLAMAMLETRLPETSWTILVSSLGFTLGFVVIILGRQGSVAESSLVAVLPVLSRKIPGSIKRFASLWGVTLVGNLLGVLFMSALFAFTSALDETVKSSISAEGAKLLHEGPLTTLIRAGLAGWIIALAAWTSSAARTAKVAVVIALVYLTGVLGFHHLIAGSISILTAVFQGQASPWEYVTAFMIPVTFGNFIGGACFVAALNHAQVAREMKRLERTHLMA